MSYRVYCTLSTLMGKKRVTIQEVHNKTGLSRTTIANLYYDRATRVDFDTIGKLCTYFDCRLEELLHCENKSQP